MNATSADQPVPAATTSAGDSLGLWQRLAKTVDEYFARRSVRAAPETALRRCRRDASRFRKLMHGSGDIAPASRTVAATWNSR
jgi:hypothetical protein